MISGYLEGTKTDICQAYHISLLFYTIVLCLLGI